MKLALQTHPSVHSRTWRQAIRDLAADVNRQELPPIPDRAGIREPVVAHNFETRSHTLLSGSEAYTLEAGADAQVPMAIGGSGGVESHAQPSAAKHVSASSHSSLSTAGAAAAPTEDDQPQKRFRMEFNK